MGNTTSDLTNDEIEDLTTWTTFTPKEIEVIFDRFNELDIRNNGYLSFTELMRLPEFHSNPLAPLFIREIERIVDYNNISFPHFLEILEIFSVRKDAKHRILFLFKVFDLNNENRLCKHVLRKIAFMIGSTDFYSVLKDYDLENKGYLNYKDFTKFYYNENVDEVLAFDYSKHIPKRKWLNFRELIRFLFGI
ncbi:EF-Hand Ca2+-binding protein [Tubulinosema ratisbonensis]|uniref:Calcineurin subunit B n=1 Tax=Tubulinosema ratisbonensis TaxID=291195 RepID=A0A437AHF9_9MICR|nr:EF-Hand Ca2+-binding protein [Tubulinosema ratisbonensis]